MAGDERAKLRALLQYWVEHNREHSQEFREWVDKARNLGEAKIADELLRAAGDLDSASKLLSQSLERLGEG